MRELDDAALELRLRRVLAEHLDPISLSVTTRDVERRRLARDQTRRRRRVIVGLGLAAALIVPVGWLVAGAPIRTDPLLGVTIATPGPTDHLPPRATPAVVTTTTSGGYQAIVWRPGAGSGFDVIAIQADGQERVLARIASESLPAGFPSTAYVGGNGWLAVDGFDRGLVLIDLVHPAAPIRMIDGEYTSIAWGPGGRLALSLFTDQGEEPRDIIIIDPATGESIPLSPARPLATFPLAWAADGSGLLAAIGTPFVPGQPAHWQRQLVPSGTIVPGFVPIHDAGRFLRRQSIAGDRLFLCLPRRGKAACPDSDGFEVGKLDVDGALTLWDVAPSSGGVDDAVFTASDRGIWILRRDPVAGVIALDRRDGQGVVVRGVTAPLAAGLTPAANARQVDWQPVTGLDAISPDDSLARIWMRNDDPDITEWFLLPTDGSPGTYHREGPFAGYLAASVADTIGTDAFRPVPGADRPEEGHAPALPSNDDMDRYAASSWGVRATDAVLRATWSQGQEPPAIAPVPLPAGHRLGVQFACSGPRTAHVTARDADPNGGSMSSGWGCMADDQRFPALEVEAATFDRLIPIGVSVEGGASWRLVAYVQRP